MILLKNNKEYVFSKKKTKIIILTSISLANNVTWQIKNTTSDDFIGEKFCSKKLNDLHTDTYQRIPNRENVIPKRYSLRPWRQWGPQPASDTDGSRDISHSRDCAPSPHPPIYPVYLLFVTVLMFNYRPP